MELRLEPALSVVIRRLAGEMRNRALGPREVERIGAAIGYALVDINKRLVAGEVPRRDGFFEIPTDNVDRSAADEIYEAVLIAAQGEYEERKLALYGRLLASVAFRDGISRAHANYLIRIAEELSYRQIVSSLWLVEEVLAFPHSMVLLWRMREPPNSRSFISVICLETIQTRGSSDCLVERDYLVRDDEPQPGKR